LVVILLLIGIFLLVKMLILHDLPIGKHRKSILVPFPASGCHRKRNIELRIGLYLHSSGLILVRGHEYITQCV
jgi:hypothetical protein